MIDNDEYPYNSFEIIDVRLFSAMARLYQDVKVKWNKIDVKFIDKNDEVIIEQFWFDIQRFFVDFREQTNTGQDPKPYSNHEAAAISKVI